MDGILQLILVVGIIFISTFSIKVSQESIQSINAMNHQIQMMFVKG